VLAEFLPDEPTEPYTTVRERTIRIGGRLGAEVTEEVSLARAQTDEQRPLAIQLPDGCRKE
jgi:hypothetical protein